MRLEIHDGAGGGQTGRSSEFDFIVVGGGSAGCVVAAHLSEDPANQVLLIESGGRDRDPFIHIPATFYKVIAKGRDAVRYVSEPEPGLNGRAHIVPQGHVLGGGSSINGMIYIRGSHRDYDTWAQMGCREWSFEKVLPVFRALEANQRLSGAYHGVDGELPVSDRGHGHPLSWAFVRAAQECGLPYNEDFNGAKQEGVGFYQVTTLNARRMSTAVAFLRKAEGRPNLTIRTGSRVHKIVFEGRRAAGVRCEDGTHERARREIVLCAGALASPKILLLSGIGPAAHLREHGIEWVADLPGVGENFQDHLEATVQCEVNAPISMLGQDAGLRGLRHMAQYLLTRTGLLASTIIEAGGFADTAGTGEPDIQFHVRPAFRGFADRLPEPGHGVTISPCVLRPQSRGALRLRSAKPGDPARFVGNTLSAPADLETLVRGMELTLRIFDAPSLKRLVKRRALPKPGVENDPGALRGYIRDVAKTVFHPAGTCKMGPDNDANAVVDEQLRVRGVEGLRVADASIMPTLVSGNTNAPTIMIGARAARFMLQGQ